MIKKIVFSVLILGLPISNLQAQVENPSCSDLNNQVKNLSCKELKLGLNQLEFELEKININIDKFWELLNNKEYSRDKNLHDLTEKFYRAEDRLHLVLGKLSEAEFAENKQKAAELRKLVKEIEANIIRLDARLTRYSANSQIELNALSLKMDNLHVIMQAKENRRNKFEEFYSIKNCSF